ncbi:8-oxoguanine deaminase [Paenalcaligenes niemegkensis]|uniref:8-oxoguanine deaminase n=1 Tax=Paenalcaligenes niemegkensis TaxID=2895469 RepID=UPI001EE85D49|nr:8-oxoguanine deaminase [Paenalcaligenes niemegkensis]MCQ9617247.1 8-oxoguanine deaminase [Paenalcaligenes niemegkensis]
MAKILLKNIHTLATMNDNRDELNDAAIVINGKVIDYVGSNEGAAHIAVDQVIDLSNHVVLPGLINTHHHMYQTLTRAVPKAQNAELFGWLKTLYPIWERITPDMLYASTRTAMAELLQSGCTTSSDHLYLFPNGCTLEHTIEAAQEMGMRFHASRGAMSVGESKGGLPPDSLVENEDHILRDMQRLVEQHHDASHASMLRIALAPCSPFSVSQDLMRESAKLARSLKVSLHTHLAENQNDIAYSREKFNRTPAEYVEELGWTGPDVWHAHCVHLDDAGIQLFSRTKTGVAHCPCSNMRLGSGIAPIRKMMDHQVPVGLGVDGSASNDGSNMLNEARQAMLLQRVAHQDPRQFSAREALWVATRGGADVLNRNDIGQLSPNYAADLIAFDLNQLNYAGALHDPIAATLFCASASVAYSIINGKIVIQEGRFKQSDLPGIVRAHNTLSHELLSSS